MHAGLGDMYVAPGGVRRTAASQPRKEAARVFHVAAIVVAESRDQVLFFLKLVRKTITSHAETPVNKMNQLAGTVELARTASMKAQ